MSIGPSFGDEIIAAGLGGLPFSWNSNGTFTGREELSAGQNATLDTIIAAHNPNTVSTAQLRAQAFLSDTDRQTFITNIANATPAQIKTYITNNVTDLASARLILIKLALLVAATIRS